jgi:hypothetical protein
VSFSPPLPFSLSLLPLPFFFPHAASLLARSQRPSVAPPLSLCAPRRPWSARSRPPASRPAPPSAARSCPPAAAPRRPRPAPPSARAAPASPSPPRALPRPRPRPASRALPRARSAQVSRPRLAHRRARPRPPRACPRRPRPPYAPRPSPCPGVPHALAARRRPRAPCPVPWLRPRPRPCPGDSRPACLTVRVPSARLTCFHACDRSRTAVNLVLFYFKLFSRRAASCASSRDDSFNL